MITESRLVKHDELLINEIKERLGFNEANQIYESVGGYQISIDNKRDFDKLMEDYIRLLRKEIVEREIEGGF